MSPRDVIKQAIRNIEPVDSIERTHIKDVLEWIDSGVQIFRVSKPDNPPKHLVSYFVLFDEDSNKIMLIDHIKAKLWLPAGGHVEVDEDPKETVIREVIEELNIEADFSTKFKDKPLFITVTETVNADIHTDVSFWYVIKGSVGKKMDFDTEEMNDYRWFGVKEILATDGKLFDPHMHRFVKKLQKSI